MKRWAVLAIAADGTCSVYGPFTSESAALKAQRIIDSYTDSDTQVILMSKYRRADFSIYS